MNLPSGHNAQRLEWLAPTSAENRPAGQGVHASEPAASAYWPGAQLRQPVLARSTAPASKGEYCPGAQSAHASPGSGAPQPAGQAVQSQAPPAQSQLLSTL